MYKYVVDTPKTVVPKTINFSVSLDARGILVNIREQAKLPHYKDNNNNRVHCSFRNTGCLLVLFHFCLSAAKNRSSFQLPPTSLVTNLLQLVLGLPCEKYMLALSCPPAPRSDSQWTVFR